MNEILTSTVVAAIVGLASVICVVVPDVAPVMASVGKTLVGLVSNPYGLTALTTGILKVCGTF